MGNSEDKDNELLSEEEFNSSVNTTLTNSKNHIKNDPIHVSEQDRRDWSTKLGLSDSDIASATKNGSMSAADKSKLDGIDTGANNYIHPQSGVVPGEYNGIVVDRDGHIKDVDEAKLLDRKYLNDNFAKKEDPVFTGKVSVPEADAGDKSERAASTSFVSKYFVSSVIVESNYKPTDTNVIWRDLVNNKFKYYTDSKWEELSTSGSGSAVIVTNIAPDDKTALWFNSDDKNMYIYINGAWKLAAISSCIFAGPTAPVDTTKLWIKTTDNSVNYSNGTDWVVLPILTSVFNISITEPSDKLKLWINKGSMCYYDKDLSKWLSSKIVMKQPDAPDDINTLWFDTANGLMKYYDNETMKWCEMSSKSFTFDKSNDNLFYVDPNGVVYFYKDYKWEEIDSRLCTEDSTSKAKESSLLFLNTNGIELKFRKDGRWLTYDGNKNPFFVSQNPPTRSFGPYIKGAWLNPLAKTLNIPNSISWEKNKEIAQYYFGKVEFFEPTHKLTWINPSTKLVKRTFISWDKPNCNTAVQATQPGVDEAVDLWFDTTNNKLMRWNPGTAKYDEIQSVVSNRYASSPTVPDAATGPLFWINSTDNTINILDEGEYVKASSVAYLMESPTPLEDKAVWYNSTDLTVKFFSYNDNEWKSCNTITKPFIREDAVEDTPSKNQFLYWINGTDIYERTVINRDYEIPYHIVDTFESAAAYDVNALYLVLNDRAIYSAIPAWTSFKLVNEITKLGLVIPTGKAYEFDLTKEFGYFDSTTQLPKINLMVKDTEVGSPTFGKYIEGNTVCSVVYDTDASKIIFTNEITADITISLTVNI